MSDDSSRSDLPPDPWETSPVALDPVLVETSQQLMAKSDPQGMNIEPEATEPKPEPLPDLTDKMAYLQQRNAQLVAENAQLHAANQRLLDQLSQLRQARSRPWPVRAWRRLAQRKSAHG